MSNRLTKKLGTGADILPLDEVFHVIAAAESPARQTGFVSKNLRKEHGWTVSDGNTAYKIVVLDAANLTGHTLDQMMALQDKVAKVQAPDPANAIDYKTALEVLDHYSNGGTGLGVFTASGQLIGQTMITASGKNALIGWVMVDPAYRGNQLCASLIHMSRTVAAEQGAEQVEAHVRTHNKAAIAKFSNAGFIVTGSGANGKDGSTHLKFTRPALQEPQLGEEIFIRPITTATLEEVALSGLFNQNAEKGLAAKWDRIADWFTFYPVAAANIIKFEP